MENLKRVRLAKEMEDPYYLKEPKLIEIYNKSLPPKEAYYHFPPPDEIIIINQKNQKNLLEEFIIMFLILTLKII
jgi:hypothetical protein